jgi:hypothetical protein
VRSGGPPILDLRRQRYSKRSQTFCPACSETADLLARCGIPVSKKNVTCARCGAIWRVRVPPMHIPWIP